MKRLYLCKSDFITESHSSRRCILIGSCAQNEKRTKKLMQSLSHCINFVRDSRFHCHLYFLFNHTENIHADEKVREIFPGTLGARRGRVYRNFQAFILMCNLYYLYLYIQWIRESSLEISDWMRMIMYRWIYVYYMWLLSGTHRVRPGRMAARLRVNVLLVISGNAAAPLPLLLLLLLLLHSLSLSLAVAFLFYTACTIYLAIYSCLVFTLSRSATELLQLLFLLHWCSDAGCCGFF